MNRSKGFTLIELILVLALVASAIVLAAHYQNHEIRQVQARKTGQLLYQYHNAIKAYAMNGVNDFASVVVGTRTGVNWLKGTGCGGTANKDYLPCTFPETLSFGQLEFSANVTKGLNADGDEVINITTNTTPFTTLDGTPRSDLAGIAAMATAGYSSVFAPISSTFGDVSSDPKTAVITMTAFNAPGGDDVWLRTNGSNDMKGSINFSGVDAEDNNLTGVNRITAEDGGVLTLGDAGSLTGDLVVEYDSDILGQLYVQDDLNVDGMADVQGNVRSHANVIADVDVGAGRHVRAGSEVRAGTDVIAGSDVKAGRNVGAANNVTAGQDVIAGDDLEARDDLMVGDDASILGNIDIDGNAVVGQRLDVMRDLFVQNNSTLRNLNVTGNTTTRSISASGDISLTGYLNLGRTVSEGGSCSRRGSLAKLSSGAAVSCANGKWEKLNGGTAPPPPPTPRVCQGSTFNAAQIYRTYRQYAYYRWVGISVPTAFVGDSQTQSRTYKPMSSVTLTARTTRNCLSNGQWGNPRISISCRNHIAFDICGIYGYNRLTPRRG
ncbi:prepilin-type N-terminal cleavage/methylation domain-containing protein [Neptuniibacter sp. QD37_11]|uniref:prepilin-type N-terminal cleavage/methylation domain-containing protein n=1 Tax=Neptuniibacter sp. QD37_11 TaxID=3398209 RepID=UPI0039F5DACB